MTDRKKPRTHDPLWSDVRLTQGMRDGLNALVGTGLYGRNIGEAALRLIERGIEDRANAGVILRVRKEPPR